MRRLICLCVGLFAALGVHADAAASPFELYGAGGRAAATAGAQSASAKGPAAIFYNLGALAHSAEGVSGGVIAGVNRSRILLMQRPNGYDVPDLGAYSPSVPSGSEPNARRDTDDIDPLYAFTLGAVTSFGIEDFRAGLLLTVPTSGYIDVNTHFPDERERIFTNQLHYSLIDRRVRRMDIEMGVAYSVTDWLSAGIGAAFVPGSAMNTSVFIPDVSDQADVDINSDIDTESNWGLMAGVLLDITDELHFGLQLRNEVYFRVQGTNHIRLGTEGGEDERTIEQELDWTPSYSPDTVAAGLAWTVGAVQLMADARYERWSGFRDTHSQLTDFEDTISPRLGIEYTLESGNHLRAGLGWVPSPVPDQTGRTNYVDNDRAIASVGASYKFDAIGQTMQVDWALQLQMLLTRETQKNVRADYPDCAEGVDALCDEVPDDMVEPRTGQPFPEAQGLQTGNPGFPGFTAGGWLGAIVLELSWLPQE